MGALVLLVGLPGAGKSTFAAELKKRRPDIVVISSDEVRKNFFGITFDPRVEKQVWSIVHSAVIGNLKLGKTVVLDATNLTKSSRYKWIRWAGWFKKPVIAVFINPPLEVVFKQNAMREKEWVVPEEEMRKKVMLLKVPQAEEGFCSVVNIEKVDEYSVNKVIEELEKIKEKTFEKRKFIQVKQ
jgi:predicted kinase